MANLGNVGQAFALSQARGAFSIFDQNKEPTSVTLHVVSAVPGSTAVLYRGGVPVSTTGGPGGRTLADGSGNVNFYDLEDTNGQPYYIQTLGTGEDWSATVTGIAVVVTQLHVANRVTAYASA